MWLSRCQCPPLPPLRLFPQGAAASPALQWCPLSPPSLGSTSFLKCAEAFPRPPPLWKKTVGPAGQSRARAGAARTPTPSPIFPRTPHQKLWLDEQHPQSLASKTVGSSVLGLQLKWGGTWMLSEAKTGHRGPPLLKVTTGPPPCLNAKILSPDAHPPSFTCSTWTFQRTNAPTPSSAQSLMPHHLIRGREGERHLFNIFYVPGSRKWPAMVAHSLSLRFLISIMSLIWE